VYTRESNMIHYMTKKSLLRSTVLQVVQLHGVEAMYIKKSLNCTHFRGCIYQDLHEVQKGLVFIALGGLLRGPRAVGLCQSLSILYTVRGTHTDSTTKKNVNSVLSPKHQREPNKAPRLTEA
jgi:hypothetical protein